MSKSIRHACKRHIEKQVATKNVRHTEHICMSEPEVKKNNQAKKKPRYNFFLLKLCNEAMYMTIFDAKEMVGIFDTVTLTITVYSSPGINIKSRYEKEAKKL